MAQTSPNLRRISYASTDVAGQLVFCVISFYLLKFYTDVFGVSAGVAGTILLIARCVDAVDTPVWGVVFDRTRSRWGKSRPWFLRLCVPFALFGFLTFFTPALGDHGKAIYATITYITCSILYTGINTPVTSILSNLTAEPKERLVLNSWRMFGSKFGVLIVNLTALRLVALLGQGNDRLGFERTMAIYCIGSVVLFLFAFTNLEETVPADARKMPVADSFKALKGNWPWIILFASNLFFWVAFIARISAAPYFFEYTLHRASLTSFANALDATSLATILAIPFLVRWTSKRMLWVWGLVGAVLSQLVVYAGSRVGSVPWVMTGWTLGFLTSGIAMALPFSMVAETIDYGEWKTRIRAPGLLTAIGTAFCIKAGAGLGGALPAWLLHWYRYVPNVAQTPRSLIGIELGVVWVPALFYALAIVPLFFYRSFESAEPTIRRELEDRRALAAAEAQTG